MKWSCMKWSPCSRRPPRLPRTHEGPLPTLRVLQCSPPLAHALFGASSCLWLLAGVCVLGLHDPLPCLRPTVLADAPTLTPGVASALTPTPPPPYACAPWGRTTTAP